MFQTSSRHVPSIKKDKVILESGKDYKGEILREVDLNKKVRSYLLKPIPWKKCKIKKVTVHRRGRGGRRVLNEVNTFSHY